MKIENHLSSDHFEHNPVCVKHHLTSDVTPYGFTGKKRTGYDAFTSYPVILFCIL